MACRSGLLRLHPAKRQNVEIAALQRFMNVAGLAAPTMRIGAMGVIVLMYPPERSRLEFPPLYHDAPLAMPRWFVLCSRTTLWSRAPFDAAQAHRAHFPLPLAQQACHW